MSDPTLTTEERLTRNLEVSSPVEIVRGPHQTHTVIEQVHSMLWALLKSYGLESRPFAYDCVCWSSATKEGTYMNHTISFFPYNNDTQSLVQFQSPDLSLAIHQFTTYLHAKFKPTYDNKPS